MSNEVKAFKTQKTLAIIYKKHLLKHSNVIPTIWAMKIKSFSSGSFKSFKASFCVRGDLQKKAIEEIDTYAPVIPWSTVYLLLIISLVLKLQARSTNFSNASVQTDIVKRDVWLADCQLMQRNAFNSCINI
eukprot:15363208-Ditylum_brightwellii.AAC.1